MSAYRPIFASSTARSGSYLISMMLSTNPEITIASEPYLELFRSVRNALVMSAAPPDVAARFDTSLPFQDYYFTDDRIAVMDAVQRGSLDIPFPAAEWPGLLEASKVRSVLQCAEMTPFLDQLVGPTYKAAMDNALEIVARSRAAHDRRWVGIKDAWVIELFAPLARAYPDARFLIILRDPRAITHSMLQAGPSIVAQPLSYARHWRKYVAFALRYRDDPLFAGRLHVVTHERVLRDPEREARAMCEFLEVEYDDAMLDTERYFDYSTGATWRGNSSFEPRTSGIRPMRAERWRSGLDGRCIALVDLVCGAEMRLVGYEPVADAETPTVRAAAVEYHLENIRAFSKWRSDLGDPQRDLGYEFFRRAVIGQADPAGLDPAVIRRSFLFEEAFRALRQPDARLVPD